MGTGHCAQIVERRRKERSSQRTTIPKWSQFKLSCLPHAGSALDQTHSSNSFALETLESSSV
eukprot:3955386-Amphidinium_carterae.1